MKLCESCVATFGANNAKAARVKVKSVLTGKPRELCEDHAYNTYISFGADYIIDWPNWDNFRLSKLEAIK